MQPEPTSSGAGVALSSDDHLRLITDGLANYAAPLANALGATILIPLMLRELGAELYGTWVVALALAGLLARFRA